jgi:hypothetical protein
MQHIDLNAAKAAKATDRRALAILAYDNASANPAAANWRGVAELLRLALPTAKAKAIEPATESRFAPWADYPIPHNASGKRLGKSPVVVVSFADGETVRAPAVSLPGKPVNIGRALRVAVAFYQARIVGRYNALIPDNFGAGLLSSMDSEFVATIPLPAVVSVICETTGGEYDPAACSEMVARSRPVAPATVDSPVTADFVAPSRFLASTSLVRDIPGLPVAPSCILRVA